MAQLKEVVKFLDKELRIKEIKDSSRNGLQVKASNKEIKKIGFAVDACLSTFKKAKKEKVDLLIVHHGIKWKPQKYKELTRIREQFLKQNKISLYAAHLPLDAHEKYGNNIGLCRILNLTNTKKFGKYHGVFVGFKGNFKKEVRINKIADVLNKELNTRCKTYSFGKNKIRTAGIVSGGGSASIEEAVQEKINCLIYGENTLSAYHRAKDYGLNIIVAGHYATETVGVKLLMPVIQKRFKTKTIFIDNPTGI